MAFEYLKMARNIPRAIEPQSQITNKKCLRYSFVVLLVCNLLFPLLEAPILIAYNNQLFIKNETPSIFITYCAYIVPDLVGVFQIVSGILLINGVYLIHSFFKEIDAEVRINTKYLLLHGSAFGLYLLSDVILYTSYNVYIFNTERENQYMVASIFWVCASFFSQICLCAILWDLGSVIEVERELTDTSIQVIDFDEEAEVQAKIWNKFMRNPEPQGRYVVDANQIVNYRTS